MGWFIRQQITGFWNGDHDKVQYYRKMAIHLVTCFLFLAYIAATLNYLIFKFRLYIRHGRQTIASPWLLLLLACECLYFLTSLLSAIENLLPPSRRRTLQPLDIYKDHIKCPIVHVLLPCCNEPTRIQTETIRAALGLDYAQDRFKVLVLDDGGQDELKSICDSLQAEDGGQTLQYLRRTKLPGLPHHFKCGNLNYGLKHSVDSEYVVIVDADMIVHPSFLRRMLPYLVDSPNVAFTQIPQCYYNLPAGDLLNSSCVMIYDKILPHRDSVNMATCVGTGAVFRRSHLDSIGGFQPHSVSEDTNTSYMLLAQGFESVYVHERLQIGLAPWTFEAFLKQRIRWGRGAIQQMATWKILLGPSSKLTWLQKGLVFWHTGYYVTPIINSFLLLLLFVMLALNLNLSVGSLYENLDLVTDLSVGLVTWRILWMIMWVGMEKPTRTIDTIQARNREESYFWWMAPYLLVMLMKMINWNKSFVFRSTGNIDMTGKRGKQPVGRFSQVKVHLVCVVSVVAIVLFRVIYATGHHADCVEWFRVIGLSLFLVTTSFHMLVPILFLANQKSHLKLSDRESLLSYDARGVPEFVPELLTGRPQWSWSVLLYEALSIAVLAFWAGVLCFSVAMKSHQMGWCDMQQSF